MGLSDLQVAISIASGVVALLIVVALVRNRLPGNLVFGGLVLLELAQVAQLVWGVVLLARGDVDVNAFVYIGYLLGALLVLPIGFAWSASERNRGGTGVLLVAVLIIPVLCLRLHDLVAL